MAKEITWVEAHPTRDVLAIGRSDDVILWETSKQIVLQRVPIDSWVTNVRWSPDGTMLIVAGNRGRLTICDEAGAIRRSVDTGIEQLLATAFHSSGALFATGGDNGITIVWKAGDAFVESYRTTIKSSRVRSVAFADDTLLVGSEEGCFDAFTENGTKSPAGGQVFGRGALASIGVNPKFKCAMFGGGSGKMFAMRTVPPWDVITEYPVPPRPIAVNQISFSRQADKFVAACSDDVARLFNWSEPSVYGVDLGQAFYHRHPKPEWSRDMIVASACFDKSGARVYTAHWSGMVKVWDISDVLLKNIQTLRFDDNGAVRHRS